MTADTLDWISLGRVEDLPEGGVKTGTARKTSVCLMHFDGQWAAVRRVAGVTGPALVEIMTDAELVQTASTSFRGGNGLLPIHK